MNSIPDHLFLVDGGWSEWSDSECSVTCGDGTITRERTCTNPEPEHEGAVCDGEPSASLSCNIKECPSQFTPCFLYKNTKICRMYLIL